MEPTDDYDTLAITQSPLWLGKRHSISNRSWVFSALLVIVHFIFLQQYHRGITASHLTYSLAFVLAVALSRGLSILTHWLVKKHIGLQVIEYDNQQELTVMRGRIGALSGVRMEVESGSSITWIWRGKIYPNSYNPMLYEEYTNGATQTSTVCTIRSHNIHTRTSVRETVPMMAAMLTVCLCLSFLTLHLAGPWGILNNVLPVAAVAVFSLMSPWRRVLVLCKCGIDAQP